MSETAYPTADGSIDYEEIINQLNLDGVSPVNPTYFSDGAETFAVIGVKPSKGLYSFVHLTNAHNREVFEAELKSLYAEYENGGLMFRNRKFLAPFEGTFDSVEESSVPDSLLNNIADALEDSEADHDTLLSEIDTVREASSEHAVMNE
jgi:hypothetical protein